METKTCCVCKQTLPVAAFGVNNAHKDRLMSYCKDCGKAREKRYKDRDPEAWRAKRNEIHNRYLEANPGLNAFYSRRWRAANPELAKDHLLKTHYGLPIGDYDRMLSTQGGKCAICGTEASGLRGMRFHVDHDHDTGLVRGLLCHNCNVGIGGLKHSEEILDKAKVYLRDYTKG